MTNYKMLLSEVRMQYISYRRCGFDRSTAIQILTEKYINELQDKDDISAVVDGIVIALCQKKELSKEIAQQMLTYLSKISCSPSKKMEQLLSTPEVYGSEAAYRHRKPYDPQWQKGDLFSHKLISPRAHALGIAGWSVLFYKVDDYENDRGKQVQLVYTSLCLPGQEPSSDAQLQSLGFLRMMCHGEKWDYLSQIEAKSRRYIDSYGLIKIGNFPFVLPPADRTEEDPFVAMPMFGILKKDDVYPSFEDQVCNVISRCKRANVTFLSQSGDSKTD